MAKKQIIGKSKLLQEAEVPIQKEEPLNLTIPKKKKPTLKNFRLTELDCENLRKITEAVNRISPHKTISETTIVKALLLVGSKLSPEKILKAAKEAL